MSTTPPTTPVSTTVAPTTIAPTTIAPTTILPTTVGPTTIAPTTLIPTTPFPGWTIDAGPITIPVTIVNAMTVYPTPPVDHALDQYADFGVIEITLSLEGEQANVGISVEPIEIVIDLDGSLVIGTAIDCDALDIEIELYSYGYIVSSPKTNWVKWSKIGHLDFTIDESNIAGERPVDWKGSIYCIKKLLDKVMIYGENGVTVFKAAGVSYGMETVYRVGLAGKRAVTGTDFEHFFIDNLGQMWKMSDKLEKLDYSEYLSTLTDPVMSLDVSKGIIYICDGVKGFVYGVVTGSFGEGPVNVTGVDSQTGVTYVAAPDIIETPKFEICTDVFDFGTRKAKTVYSIEVGSDLTENLHASIDYRNSYKSQFVQIPWFLVNPGGYAYPKCYGIEFRFRLRSFMYEYFEIDYLKIGGMIHDFSYLDTTAERAYK